MSPQRLPCASCHSHAATLLIGAEVHCGRDLYPQRGVLLRSGGGASWREAPHPLPDVHTPSSPPANSHPSLSPLLSLSLSRLVWDFTNCVLGCGGEKNQFPPPPNPSLITLDCTLAVLPPPKPVFHTHRPKTAVCSSQAGLQGHAQPDTG